MSEVSSGAGVRVSSVSSPVQILQTLGIARGDSGTLSFSDVNDRKRKVHAYCMSYLGRGERLILLRPDNPTQGVLLMGKHNPNYNREVVVLTEALIARNDVKEGLAFLDEHFPEKKLFFEELISKARGSGVPGFGFYYRGKFTGAIVKEFEFVDFATFESLPSWLSDVRTLLKMKAEVLRFRCANESTPEGPWKEMAQLRLEQKEQAYLAKLLAEGCFDYVDEYSEGVVVAKAVLEALANRRNFAGFVKAVGAIENPHEKMQMLLYAERKFSGQLSHAQYGELLSKAPDDLVKAKLARQLIANLMFKGLVEDAQVVFNSVPLTVEMREAVCRGVVLSLFKYQLNSEETTLPLIQDFLQVAEEDKSLFSKALVLPDESCLEVAGRIKNEIHRDLCYCSLAVQCAKRNDSSLAKRCVEALSKTATAQDLIANLSLKDEMFSHLSTSRGGVSAYVDLISDESTRRALGVTVEMFS